MGTFPVETVDVVKQLPGLTTGYDFNIGWGDGRHALFFVPHFTLSASVARRPEKYLNPKMGAIYGLALSSSSIQALTLSPRAMRAMLSIDTLR